MRLLFIRRANRVAVVAALLIPLLVSGCQRPVGPANGTQSGKTNDSAPAFDQGPPAVPDKFVLQPTIHAERKSYSAGTAFAVQHPDLKRPIILTCLHIFGTGGGYATDIPPLELSRVVKKVSFSDKFSGEDLGQVVGGFIPIPDSAPLNTPSKAGDIAAMWGSEQALLSTGILASKSPGIGEPVWLASRLIGEEESSKKLHGAVVTSHDYNLLGYRFDDAGLQLRATSGSPVLNARGEVVAIHLGGGPEGGRLLGWGNPASVFAPYLLTACKLNAAANKPRSGE